MCDNERYVCCQRSDIKQRVHVKSVWCEKDLKTVNVQHPFKPLQRSMGVRPWYLCIRTYYLSYISCSDCFLYVILYSALYFACCTIRVLENFVMLLSDNNYCFQTQTQILHGTFPHLLINDVKGKHITWQNLGIPYFNFIFDATVEGPNIKLNWKFWALENYILGDRI